MGMSVLFETINDYSKRNALKYLIGTIEEPIKQREVFEGVCNTDLNFGYEILDSIYLDNNKLSYIARIKFSEECDKYLGLLRYSKKYNKLVLTEFLVLCLSANDYNYSKELVRWAGKQNYNKFSKLSNSEVKKAHSRRKEYFEKLFTQKCFKKLNRTGILNLIKIFSELNIPEFIVFAFEDRMANIYFDFSNELDSIIEGIYQTGAQKDQLYRLIHACNAEEKYKNILGKDDEFLINDSNTINKAKQFTHSFYSFIYFLIKSEFIIEQDYSLNISIDKQHRFLTYKSLYVLEQNEINRLVNNIIIPHNKYGIQFEQTGFLNKKYYKRFDYILSEMDYFNLKINTLFASVSEKPTEEYAKLINEKNDLTKKIESKLDIILNILVYKKCVFVNKWDEISFVKNVPGIVNIFSQSFLKTTNYGRLIQILKEYRKINNENYEHQPITKMSVLWLECVIRKINELDKNVDGFLIVLRQN